MSNEQNTAAITTIQSISDRGEAMAEALRRFRAGNEKGEGFDRDLLMGGVALMLTRSSGEVSVWTMPDGSEVAIGDVNGPWAVEITPAQPAPIKLGDIVEGGNPGTDDWDYGEVVEMRASRSVVVAWSGSNEQTMTPLETLSIFDGEEKFGTESKS